MKHSSRILRSSWFWLLLVSLLPLLPLFHEGIPLTHDGRIHIARVANFYASLTEGNIVPRWASNLNWGYGSPILEFVYPLPSYIASLFHGFGASLPMSVKLVFGFSYIASIVAMFIWVKEQWDQKAGIVAAVLYGFAPYRFVDLYVRGALGEHMAFIFPPLICYFIIKLRHALTKHQNIFNPWMLALSLSIGGLILSHNALSLLFLPVTIMYGILNIYMEKNHRMTFFYYLLLSFGFGFLLTAFFWIPAIFEAKYTLQEKVTFDVISANFVPLSWFIYSPWNYGGSLEFTKSLGIPHWIAGIALLLSIPKMKKHFRFASVLILFLFIASLFTMTKQSNFLWSYIPFLQRFQFPWRVLSLSIFLSSVFGGISFYVLMSKQKKRSTWNTILTVVIITGIVFSTAEMWKPKAYLIEPETKYTGIFDGTTDSGELSPIWSVRFMEKRALTEYEVIGGQAKIRPIGRTTTKHSFTVEAVTESRILDNTLYFPGWEVSVNGRKIDNVRELIYQDPAYRGLMTFRVPAGESRVVVKFGDTKLRKVANILSISGFIVIVLYEAFRRYRHVQ